MVDTLALFADQVTVVAREVGIEGKLGGQASVPGVLGTWKDLVENVNRLAANLTTQVRAIAEVATAVAQGDLTRSIMIEAIGEMDALKNNINQMIHNLSETTRITKEQDWLKTNLTKFTRMLQGQRDITTVAQTLLSELSPLVKANHGVFYIMENTEMTHEVENENQLTLLASYGYKERKNISNVWKVGEGLVGQATFEKQMILLTNVPDNYIQITSGLGQAKPLNIIVLPIIFEGSVKAVIELASFELFSQIYQNFLEQLSESIGIVLNTIESSSRTEKLLGESQSLSEELQSQQSELQQTNEELEEKAQLLSDKNLEIERRNSEIEVAQKSLEEKALELSLSSKYKSEFLANMSHELRTPLNSLLILSNELSQNQDNNLTKKQVEFAQIINSSGNDLLGLINDILDLSKIEAGKMTVDLENVTFTGIRDDIERVFRPMAVQKALKFGIQLDPSLPNTISSDSKKLQQIIKNLLSNAFKFTNKGSVEFRMYPATSGWNTHNTILNNASRVIAFAVTDTGIGIPQDQQKIIFEAFQQGDGTTTRKYGGTGLGLSISRELAYLLGGEIRVKSAVDEGSTFTLYLPETYVGRYIPFISQSKQKEMNNIPPMLSPMPLPQEFIPLKKRDRYSDDIQAGDRVLLIIEDDSNFSSILADMGREQGFKPVITSSGEEAISLANEYKPAAITLDIHLPDLPDLPDLSDEKCNMLNAASSDDSILKDKKILIVDDDMRNIFSLTGMLEQRNMVVENAVNGKEALKILAKEPGIKLVLMDIMMPEMDGYETTQAIRKMAKFKSLPIIALTAKAMKEDKKKCMNAGCSDYITKPVDTTQLLTMIKMWLYK
ncbi:MAG: response regulator [bacterium]